MLNGFIFKKINKNKNIKEKLKSWEPFRSCLLNSTANPAQFTVTNEQQRSKELLF